MSMNSLATGPILQMRTILLACLLGFLALGTTGCLTANGVANRVVTAPNLQRSYRGIDRIAGLWEKGLNGARDPFRAMDVPVGGATIRCAILEPAAYKTEVSSTLREAPGGKSTLEVKFRFHTVTNQAEPLACRGTVFLVHGYMGCKEMLYPWAFILAGQGFRVVAVDLRGHGKSTGETFLFGKQEAGDLRTLLDSLESSFPVHRPGSGSWLLHWRQHLPPMDGCGPAGSDGRRGSPFQRTARNVQADGGRHETAGSRPDDRCRAHSRSAPDIDRLERD